MSEITVRVADWHKDNAELRRIRDTVFVAEQSVPPELEWDAEDADAVHFLVEEGDYAVGTARIVAFLAGEAGERREAPERRRARQRNRAQR